MKSEATGEPYEWNSHSLEEEGEPEDFKTKTNREFLLRLACQNQFVFFLPSTSREAEFMFLRDSPDAVAFLLCRSPRLGALLEGPR